MSNAIVIETLTREYGEALLAYHDHRGASAPDPVARAEWALEEERLRDAAGAAKNRLLAVREGHYSLEALKDWYALTWMEDFDMLGGGMIFTSRAAMTRWLEVHPERECSVGHVFLVRNYERRKDISREIAGELIANHLASGQTLEEDTYPRFCDRHLTRDEMLKLVRP